MFRSLLEYHKGDVAVRGDACWNVRLWGAAAFERLWKQYFDQLPACEPFLFEKKRWPRLLTFLVQKCYPKTINIHPMIAKFNIGIFRLRWKIVAARSISLH